MRNVSFGLLCLVVGIAWICFATIGSYPKSLSGLKTEGALTKAVLIKKETWHGNTGMHYELEYDYEVGGINYSTDKQHLQVSERRYNSLAEGEPLMVVVDRSDPSVSSADLSYEEQGLLHGLLIGVGLLVAGVVILLVSIVIQLKSAGRAG